MKVKGEYEEQLLIAAIFFSPTDGALAPQVPLAADFHYIAVIT